jgi:GDP-D-mannose dehydratase
MKALITGITGMDGTYLAEFLIKKGYQVTGLVRDEKSAQKNPHLPKGCTFIECDITDQESIETVIKHEKPEEIYSLAAVSDYAIYSKDPYGSSLVNGLAPILIMEAIRKTSIKTKMFQAGTCQSFGKPDQIPQDENTPFRPPNPYAASKVWAHFMAENYRRQFGLFIVNGILYNHESPRRLPAFVTRKITSGVAAIKKGKSDSITLGNLDSTRDWGYAGDFVEAFWLTLQQDKPDNYVIGTGEKHTIRDFVKEAFAAAGIKDWQKHIKQDPALLRGSDADFLQANPSKIKNIGWKPKTTFKDIITMMIDHDIKQ